MSRSINLPTVHFSPVPGVGYTAIVIHTPWHRRVLGQTRVVYRDGPRWRLAHANSEQLIEP